MMMLFVFLGIPQYSRALRGPPRINRIMNIPRLGSRRPPGGIFGKILESVSDGEQKISGGPKLSPMLSRTPLVMNSFLTVWLFGSVYSILSVLQHFSEHNEESFSDIFALDRMEVSRWPKDTFPAVPGVKKIIDTVVPVLRALQFFESILYPDDDNGDSWNRLLISWWNSKF